MSEWLKAYRENHADFDQPSAIDALPADPFAAFSLWFDAAVNAQEREANACVLSTTNAELQTSSRVLYLKELVEQQFVFYTNYSSHKGQELLLNPKASLLFFWPQLMRQVRIEGRVNKLMPLFQTLILPPDPAKANSGHGPLINLANSLAAQNSLRVLKPMIHNSQRSFLDRHTGEVLHSLLAILNFGKGSPLACTNAAPMSSVRTNGNPNSSTLK